MMEDNGFRSNYDGRDAKNEEEKEGSATFALKHRIHIKPTRFLTCGRRKRTAIDDAGSSSDQSEAAVGFLNGSGFDEMEEAPQQVAAAAAERSRWREQQQRGGAATLFALLSCQC